MNQRSLISALVIAVVGTFALQSEASSGEVGLTRAARRSAQGECAKKRTKKRRSKKRRSKKRRSKKRWSKKRSQRPFRAGSLVKSSKRKTKKPSGKFREGSLIKPEDVKPTSLPRRAAETETPRPKASTPEPAKKTSDVIKLQRRNIYNIWPSANDKNCYGVVTGGRNRGYKRGKTRFSYRGYSAKAVGIYPTRTQVYWRTPCSNLN